MGSRKWYDYSFFNTLPASEKEKAFEKFAVPESYKVSRQLVLNSFSNIDFKKPHVPILFIGGENDNIFPPGLTKTLAGKYKDPNSRVNVKIFENKSHFICGEPGWEKSSRSYFRLVRESLKKDMINFLYKRELA